MRFVLLEAAPWRVSDGVAENVRIAGGGSKPYSGLRGFTDWRSGLGTLPMFHASSDFNESGWSGGAIPQTAVIKIYPSTAANRDALLRDYLWKGAPIELRSGDDELAPGTYIIELTGMVDGVSTDGGSLVITVADLSRKLDVPIVKTTFAGTGGVEGPAELEGRPKRRSWGVVKNIEGFLIEKPNNIFEFGDPAFPIEAFDSVKDMGRAASPTPTILAWQGSIAATFTALAASSPAAGSCVVAPSIACVKWWTVPNGPLTADIRGHNTGGYVNKIADIAGRAAQAVHAAQTIAAGDYAAIIAARPGVAGLHVGDTSETAAQALDRLLLPCNVLWALNPDGSIRLAEIQLTTSAETLTAIDVDRLESFRPVRQIKLGYQRNHREHDDGEVSAALTGAVVTGPAQSTTFTYDYLGAADPSTQFPRALVFKLMQGGTQVTTGITWTYRVLAGTVNGFTQADGVKSMTGSGSGTLTVNSLGTDTASIEVIASYAGGSSPLTFPLNRTYSAPPSGGGGGGGGGATTIAGKSSGWSTINSTTFTTIGTMNGTMPAGKTAADLSATVTFTASSGSNSSLSVEMKWQRNISSVWTDVGAAVSGNTQLFNSPEEGELVNPAVITVNRSESGLTAGATYDWRLVARLTSGSRLQYVDGNASVVVP
jgi:hypothetical protein